VPCVLRMPSRTAATSVTSGEAGQIRVTRQPEQAEPAWLMSAACRSRDGWCHAFSLPPQVRLPSSTSAFVGTARTRSNSRCISGALPTLLAPPHVRRPAAGGTGTVPGPLICAGHRRGAQLSRPCLLSMCRRAGFVFDVLALGFVIHFPHPKSSSKQKWALLPRTATVLRVPTAARAHHPTPSSRPRFC
jgi:hypothetical protein